MAHFAEIDSNSIVLRVLVISNSDTSDMNGSENEQIGIDFCKNIFGGNWIQTSYNKNFRKNYAGIGYFYDNSRDAFIPPRPYQSWILDEESCSWVAPIPHPIDMTALS